MINNNIIKALKKPMLSQKGSKVPKCGGGERKKKESKGGGKKKLYSANRVSKNNPKSTTLPLKSKTRIVNKTIQKLVLTHKYTII